MGDRIMPGGGECLVRLNLERGNGVYIHIVYSTEILITLL